ncbi:50S rRNA methyltransferase [Candidatus Magnetoovum chiemensis]|nr:50S rRNA methyltransferase [Candidatus Magnetoovum chiemensis]
MGEPLENFDNVTEALKIITELIGFSKRRITLSTAGIVPKMVEFFKKAPAVNLAVSLNAPSNAVRNEIMPINNKYPLSALLDACKRLPIEPRRRITFEYVLLSGVNDSVYDAVEVAKILKGIKCKINIIPFNEYEGAKYKSPEEETVLAFQAELFKRNIPSFIRKSKGQDISAACGQLKAAYRR